jgi:hypothetical protein
LLSASSGCRQIAGIGDYEVTDSGVGGSGGAGGGGAGVSPIDLLLAIDNSRSMGDKQAMLALAVPDLIDGLTNPACVEPNTGARTVVGGPTAACPTGTERASSSRSPTSTSASSARASAPTALTVARRTASSATRPTTTAVASWTVASRVPWGPTPA